ncbi:mannose-binding protein C-like [Pollicipes pollicipes]|uniref:mannose-binding protein C-like n=1 Tax=Pollicipes pollicipes TaxID=41117 RepID=UPI0018851492|nr:mannose-binding protein C-like [Pollicipes pollicipes]
MLRHAAGRRWLLLAALLCLSDCSTDSLIASSLRRAIREELAGALSEHGCDLRPPEFVACSGRCYLPLVTAVTHEQATAHCAQLGARLAVPRTLKENLCAAGLAGHRSVWLGITDLAVKGEFVDQDGRSVAEVLGNVWSEGQPDNYQNREDCVEIWPTNTFPNVRFAEWNDRDCSAKAIPMCQLDL